MNPLQKIEQTYNFQYPKLYHQLWEGGMLDVRWQKERWWEEVFPELKKNPPLLITNTELLLNFVSLNSLWQTLSHKLIRFLSNI